MSREKSIILRSPRLVKLRTELRSLLRLCLENQVSLLRSESIRWGRINNPEKAQECQQKIESLQLLHLRSICVCRFCGHINKDMIFNHNKAQWLCIECNLHFKGVDLLKSKIPLKIYQIRMFLKNLSKRLDLGNSGSNCDGSFSYSRFILKEMDIDSGTLNNFLRLCQEYGGDCDCEIIFNVQDRLLSWK